MDYDEEFWNKYADENESRNNEEFAKLLEISQDHYTVQVF